MVEYITGIRFALVFLVFSLEAIVPELGFGRSG